MSAVPIETEYPSEAYKQWLSNLAHSLFYRYVQAVQVLHHLKIQRKCHGVTFQKENCMLSTLNPTSLHFYFRNAEQDDDQI
jgi:hypothetical protein